MRNCLQKKICYTDYNKKLRNLYLSPNNVKKLCDRRAIQVAQQENNERIMIFLCLCFRAS